MRSLTSRCRKRRKGAGKSRLCARDHQAPQAVSTLTKGTWPAKWRAFFFRGRHNTHRLRLATPPIARECAAPVSDPTQGRSVRRCHLLHLGTPALSARLRIGTAYAFSRRSITLSNASRNTGLYVSSTCRWFQRPEARTCGRSEKCPSQSDEAGSIAGPL
jgi:hypothetical protein